MLAGLTLREKILLVVAFTLVLGGAFYFWVFLPMQDELQALVMNKDQKQMELQRARITVQRLPQLDQQLQAVQRRVDLLAQVIPPDFDVNHFLFEIEELALELGIRFKTFRPQGIVTKTNYGEVSYRLNISGNYRDIVLFLQALEDSPLLVDIRSLTMTGLEGEGWDWVDLTINVVTFFRL